MMDSIFSLKGKVAIVTGGSYGLGVIFASALADAGADIVAAARSEDRLQDTKKLIESKGRRCLTLRCDVTDSEDVKRLMKRTWEEFGAIDVLVNNAGISDVRGWRTEHQDVETFVRIVNTNLIGLFYCCHAASQYMLRQGRGSIINIGSILGMGGFSGGPVPGYFASKGGVHNLTQMLASEWADRGVRVNALAPTFFDSEMAHDAMQESGVLPMLAGRHPARRIGEPDDLVGPIVFLASDASKFVTGVVLPVDGGLTATRGGYAGPYPSDEWDTEGRGHPLVPGTPWK
ncbi:MAG: glucose 1-dehydrogenase [Chloroflexi bacterium]|nr:glucose 1-dehydrogenase [Chloroflexota bacterium]